MGTGLKLNGVLRGSLRKRYIYKVTLMTGSQNNILGITFSDNSTNYGNIEVIEWNFFNNDESKIRTSK